MSLRAVEFIKTVNNLKETINFVNENIQKVNIWKQVSNDFKEILIEYLHFISPEDPSRDLTKKKYISESDVGDLQAMIYSLVQINYLFQLMGGFFIRNFTTFDIDRPIKEINEVIRIMEDHFANMNLKVGITKKISNDSVKTDLENLYSVYKSQDLEGKSDDFLNKFHQQIQRIEALFNEYGFDIPSEIKEIQQPKLRRSLSHEGYRNLSDKNIISQNKLYSTEYFKISIADVQFDGEDVKKSVVIIDMPNNFPDDIIPQREFLILSSFSDKFSIAQFLCGSITKETISVVYSSLLFKPIFSTLNHSLHHAHSSQAQLTITACKIAMGMEYLHSQNIIHSNLSTHSILLTNYFPCIWVCRALPTSERIMPPEFFNKGIYTKKSDVYQFGLLLWEIAKREEPFSKINSEKIQITVTRNSNGTNLDLDYRNKDQNGKYVLPAGMKDLIEKCTHFNPDLRPTFSEIVKQFLEGTIFYANADVDVLKKELTNIRNQMYKTKNPKVMETDIIMNNIEKKTIPDFLKPLLDMIRKKNAKDLDFCIESKDLVNKLIPFLDLSFYSDEKIQSTAISLNDLFDLIYILKIIFDKNDKFIDENDDVAQTFILHPKIDSVIITNIQKYIITYIQSSNQKIKDHGYDFIESIIKYLQINADESDNNTFELLRAVIDDKKLNVALNILRRVLATPNKNSLTNLNKLFSEKVEDISHALTSKSKNDAISLIYFYLEHNSDPGIFLDHEAIMKIPFSDVIESGCSDLLDALMKYPTFVGSFTNKEAFQVIKNVLGSDKSLDQKKCAIHFAKYLDHNFLVMCSESNELINELIKISNEPIAFNFLAILSQFEIASKYIITKTEFLSKSIQNPFCLATLSRISQYYPDQVIQIPHLLENLNNNLNNRFSINLTIRLLGSLSLIIPKFCNDDFILSIFKLLNDYQTNMTDSILLLSLISNIALLSNREDSSSEFNKAVNKLTYIQQLISIAEMEGPSSPYALKAIMNFDFNIISSNELIRNLLIQIVKQAITHQNAIDKYACSKFIIQMIKINNDFKVLFSKEGYDEIVLLSATKEDDINVFIQLMYAYENLDAKINFEVLSVFDKKLNTLNCNQIPKELIDLRTRMSKSLTYQK